MHSYRIGSLLLALATFAPAQSSLKLIPIPREVRAAAERPLTHGVHIVCAAPCSTEDKFAADDLKAALLARNIPATEPEGIPVGMARVSSHPDERIAGGSECRGTIIPAPPSCVAVGGARAQGRFECEQKGSR